MSRRDDVVAALRRTEGFVSSQDLYSQIRSTGTRIGLATVYRTLTSMAADGALDTLRSPDGELTYRACASTEHHHHLTCRHCGHTLELNAAVVEAWASRVASTHGFAEVDHVVEVIGTCRACATTLSAATPSRQP